MIWQWVYRLWGEPNDQWFAIDKLHHFALSGALWAAVVALVGDPAAGYWAVNTAGPVVETAQVIRYRRWVRAGEPGAWPWMADKISIKDLLVNNTGAVVTHVIYVGVAAIRAMLGV